MTVKFRVYSSSGIGPPGDVVVVVVVVVDGISMHWRGDGGIAVDVVLDNGASQTLGADNTAAATAPDVDNDGSINGCAAGWTVDAVAARGGSDDGDGEDRFLDLRGSLALTLLLLITVTASIGITLDPVMSGYCCCGCCCCCCCGLELPLPGCC